MRRFTRKTISTVLSALLTLSCITAATLTVDAATDEEKFSAVRTAAEQYVLANQNNCSADGLLSAVQKIDGGISLDKTDYFIKHAVPGVTDDDTQSGYQICIPGSDGAVAAVFSVGGKRVGFSQNFGHTEEILHINEVAVVGTSEGFTYSGKDVIGYSGTADKIIFPQGYYGAMTELTDKTSVDNVKAVVIDTDDPNNDYNTCTRIKPSAFAKWQSLVAVQFGEHAHPRLLFDNVSANKNPDGGTYYIFAECPNLKYVKLPKTLYSQNTSISSYMFNECRKLENVIFTENDKNDKHYFGSRSFAYTGVYDFFLPSWAPMNAEQQGYAFYGGKCRTVGQVINYSENMTFVRAVALITAELNNSVSSASTLISLAKSLVAGSADAQAFANGLQFTNNVTETEDEISGTVSVSDGKDSVTVPILKYKSSFPQLKEAADAYVEENKNAVTKDGLLSAVQAVVNGVSMSDSDFYIRHAVPGVSDDDSTSGYPLKIDGSDGAVSAVFKIDGQRFGYSKTFKHEKEALKIKDYAIVGNASYASYFSYDATGNVTALKKPVEKLIFPVGYNGTVLQFTDESSILNADRVKVVIYNGLGRLKSYAFSDWDGLIAVQMGDQTHDRYGFALAENGTSAFVNCDNLKFFKFPNHINTSGYNAGSSFLPNTFFANDTLLETVVFPTTVNGMAKWYDESALTVNYGFWSLKNTAVREILLPKINMNDGINYPATGENSQTFTSPTFSGGTRNTHCFAENMTFVRAASLIAASLNSADCANEAAMIGVAKNAVTGCVDACVFAESLSYSFKETYSDKMMYSGVFTVSDGNDTFDIDVSFSKTLLSIEAENYAIDSEFNPSDLEYKVTVPYDLKSLKITGKTANGARLLAVNKDITGIEPMSISVINTENQRVTYTLKIFKDGELNSEVLANQKKAILNISGKNAVDMTNDSVFDILDIVSMKKALAYPQENEPQNIMHTTALLSGKQSKHFYESLGYINQDGVAVDTMFTGVAFMAETSWMYTYNADNPMKHNLKDWNTYIYNNLLKDGINVDAVEAAAGRVKRDIGKRNYKFSVYLPLFDTQTYFDNFGTVNGKALDFKANADRIIALKWAVDEIISAFESQEYHNIELKGFYYIKEGISDDDKKNLTVVLPAITDYIRSKGLITYFAPFNGAGGANIADNPRWDGYGFDKATFQINYFPGAADLPNARTDVKVIGQMAEKARNLGASIQIELCSLKKESITGTKEYLKGGVTYGYMNNDFLSWWIQGNGNTMNYLGNSDDSYMRSAYDEIYLFIHKKLTVQGINIQY